MEEKEKFFLFLLENYSYYKKKNSKEILQEWDELHLIKFIDDMYEMYHSERLENAFEDLDEQIKKKKKGKK